MSKPFYLSKTLWVNVIVAIVLGILGIEIGVDLQTEILLITLVNIILRIITKQPISFR